MGRLGDVAVRVARGLAIDTYAPKQEEFPDFTKFWFESPTKDGTCFVVYAHNQRSSLWVEPTTPWGEGSVNLMELSSTGETLDNIVAFWTPKKPVVAGDSLTFGYKLYWSALPPVSTPLAHVQTTRSGMGGFLEGWAPGEHYPDVWARRFAVDFVGGGLERLAADAKIEPIVSVTQGKVQDITVLARPDIKGYRVSFDWYPDSDSVEPVNMRLFLKSNDHTLSETWLYQYFPPAPDRRKYP